MKALRIVLASLAIAGCAGLVIAGPLLVMFADPVQRIAEPYVCPEDWHLLTETKTCETDTTSQCSDIFCVSPDGNSREGAKPLWIFAAATGVGALLFCGAMTVVIIKVANSGAKLPAA